MLWLSCEVLWLSCGLLWLHCGLWVDFLEDCGVVVGRSWLLLLFSVPIAQTQPFTPQTQPFTPSNTTLYPKHTTFHSKHLTMSTSGDQRKRKQTASGPSNPYQGLKNLTSDQKKTFLKLTQRKIKQTKFAYVPHLKKLGLYDPVHYLLQQVGLEGFLNLHAPTYERMTLEFLSTVTKGEGENGPFLAFNLNDEHLTLTYEEVRRAFGVRDVSDASFYEKKVFNSGQFYAAITPGLLWDNHRKGSSLPHPALRFLNQLISMTFLCSGEPSALSSFSLRILWAMSSAGKGCPDWVDVFYQRCQQLRTVGRGKIGMGGMVTLLFHEVLRKRGMQPSDFQFPPEIGPNEPYVLNFDLLKARDMLWVSDKEDKFIWLYGTSNQFFMNLPQPDRTRIGPETTVGDLNLAPDKAHRDIIEKFLGKKVPHVGDDDDDTDDDGDDDEDGSLDGDEEDVGGSGMPSADTTMEDAPPPPAATWRQRVESQLASMHQEIRELRGEHEQMEDRVYPMYYMMTAMHHFHLGQPYVDPTPDIEHDQRRRDAARASRRSGSRDPGPS